MSYANNLTFNEDGIAYKQVYQVVDLNRSPHLAKASPLLPFVSVTTPETPDKRKNWFGNGAYVWEKLADARWWAHYNKRRFSSPKGSQGIFTYQLKIQEDLLFDLTSDSARENLELVTTAVNMILEKAGKKKMEKQFTTEIFGMLPSLLTNSPDVFPERLIRGCHTVSEPKHVLPYYGANELLHIGDSRIFQICIFKEHIPNCISEGKYLESI